MTRRSVVLLLAALWTGSMDAAEATDTHNTTTTSKQTLEQQRTNYQQVVAQHGRKSPEALAAKQKLRQARQNYHAQRRQAQPTNPPSPSKHR